MHTHAHIAPYRWSLQNLLDVRLDAVRRQGRSVPLRHVALLIDEEFAEVPFDVIEARESEGRGFTLHPLVERMCVVTVHVHLGKHRKGHAVVFRETLDFCSRAGLLSAELVAGECQNLKALRLVLLVQADKFLVVLVR